MIRFNPEVSTPAQVEQPQQQIQNRMSFKSNPNDFERTLEADAFQSERGENKTSNNKLLYGIGVGVVALATLGVLGYKGKLGTKIQELLGGAEKEAKKAGDKAGEKAKTEAEKAKAEAEKNAKETGKSGENTKPEARKAEENTGEKIETNAEKGETVRNRTVDENGVLVKAKKSVLDMSPEELKKLTDDEITDFLKEIITPEERFEKLSLIAIGSLKKNILNGNGKSVKELAEIKGAEGKLRFNSEDINYLAKRLNSEKGITAIKELAKMKGADGKPRFNGRDISWLVDHFNKENEKTAIEELAKMTDRQGNSRFGGYEIHYLVEHFNSENGKTAIEELAKMTDRQGNSRFGGYEIYYLVERFNSENGKTAIEELAKMTDRQGNPRFEGADIGYFVKYYFNKENKTAIEELGKMTDGQGKPLSKFTIGYLIKYFNRGFGNEIESLVKEWDSSRGCSRYSLNDIFDILEKKPSP